jgi:hypothetical protein
MLLYTLFVLIYLCFAPTLIDKSINAYNSLDDNNIVDVNYDNTIFTKIIRKNLLISSPLENAEVINTPNLDDSDTATITDNLANKSEKLTVEKGKYKFET